NKTEVSLLLVHAQDHLMTTMTLKDIAAEIIDIREELLKK
ncbi:MAG: PTS lactose/cellobiose transporter subunit IIA, partial [Clostridium sp.]